MFAADQAVLLKAGASHDDSTTIKYSFNDIAKLTAEEYSLTDIGKKTKGDAKFFSVSIPFTGSSFLLTCSKTTKASIRDFSQAEATVDDMTSFLAKKECQAAQDDLDRDVLDKAGSHTEEILVAHIRALVSNSKETDYAVNAK